MKQFFASAVLLEVALTSSVRDNFGGDKVVSFHKGALTEEMFHLLHANNADHFGTDTDSTMHYKISRELHELMKPLDLDIEDSTESWIQHFEENMNNEDFMCVDKPDDICAKRSLQSFYNSYQSLSAIHDRIDDLAAGSNLATVGSIGSSYEGRDLKTITIADDGSKPLVFYFCNIHAREWLTPMFCTYLAENLLADGGHPLLDSFTFVILPSANPDGYEYSRTTNNLWRKTRKPNSGSSCVGTDPNRNYDANFGGIGSSSDPCSETYSGQSAFDNVEVAAIADFATSVQDRLIVHQDIHAYAQMFLSPYGYTSSLPPSQDYNRMQSFSEAAANAVEATNGLQFQYGSGSSILYFTSGSSKDWFYDSLGVIYTYTTECRGNSFQPATSQIMLSNTEIFAAMEASLEYVVVTELGGGAPTPPTIPPTSFPTAGCSDDVPSGITVGGVATPCPELDIYCAGYDFVRANCPVTCGTCDDVQLTLSKLRAAGEWNIAIEEETQTGVQQELVLAASGLAFVAVAATVAIRLRAPN